MNPLQIQKKSSIGIATSSGTITLDAAPTVGNKLVLLVGRRNSTAFTTVASTPNGGSGNPFTQVVNHVNTSAAQRCGVAIFVKEVQAGDTASVAVSGFGGITDLHLAEYSNLETLDVADEFVTNGSGASTVTSGSSGTTPATDDADALAIALFALSGGTSGGWSYNNSFAAQSTVTALSSWAERILTGTGTYSTTASWTTGRPFAAALVVLRGEPDPVVETGTTGEPQSYEWWNGSAWVANETYIAHTDPDSIDFLQSQWGDATETYEVSVSVEDSSGARSKYSNVNTLNPMEWWTGSGWSFTEKYIAHTDIDSIEIAASQFTNNAFYDWTVSVEDSSGLQSSYAAERSFLIGLVLVPSGISTVEGFGSPTIVPGARLLSPGGIASAEALGVPGIVVGARTLLPTGIASEEAFGAVTIAQAFIAPSGIASAESFGTALIVPGARTLLVSGIASQESVPSPAISFQKFLLASGIASAEAFGNPTLRSVITLLPNGIPSAGAFGNAVLTIGVVRISPTGIASLEAFGSVFVLPPGTAWFYGERTFDRSLDLVPSTYMVLIDNVGWLKLMEVDDREDVSLVGNW